MAVQAHVGHVGVDGVQGHSAGEIYPCVLRITQSFRDPLFDGESLADRYDGGTIDVLRYDRVVGKVEFDAVGECDFGWAHARAYELAREANNA